MMAIAIAKSICKEYSTSLYSRVVYLENGQEFQIQLFNPHKFTIGAEIYINDEKLSNRLVLKPGERVWLERYLDVKKKFKFSTYEVEGNNTDVQEAIKDNGKIEVKFYREVRKKEWINYSSISTSGNDWFNKHNTSGYPSTIDVYYSSTTTGNCCDSVFPTSTCCALDTNYSASISSPTEMICETGRIEAGSISNQEFDEIDMDFEYLPFITEKIKLLPISQKPYTVNDLHKIYCAECGRKLKTTYKFCPYCGSKID